MMPPWCHQVTPRSHDVTHGRPAHARCGLDAVAMESHSCGRRDVLARADAATRLAMVYARPRSHHRPPRPSGLATRASPTTPVPVQAGSLSQGGCARHAATRTHPKRRVGRHIRSTRRDAIASRLLPCLLSYQPARRRVARSTRQPSMASCGDAMRRDLLHFKLQ